MKFIKPCDPSLGEEIKNFYLDVISEKGNNSLKKEPRLHSINPTKKKKLIRKIISFNEFVNKLKIRNISFLDKCLDNDFDINSTDIFGWTPLAISISNLDYEISNYLFSKGALLDIKIRNRYIIYDIASKAGFDLNRLDGIQEINNITPFTPKRSNRNKNFKLINKAYCQVCDEKVVKNNNNNPHENSIVHNFHLKKQLKENPYYFLPESNKGFQILLKSGWDPDYGLGVDGQGTRYPIKAKMKQDRKGVGYNKNKHIFISSSNSKLDRYSSKIEERNHLTSIQPKKSCKSLQLEDKQNEIRIRQLLYD